MDRPMSALISDLAEDLEFRKDRSIGIPTGFDGWDDRLGGLYPGELVSVVGAVGAGTSSLLLAITNAAMRGGHPVVYVSCRQTAGRLVERFVAQRANVDELRLRTGRLSEKQLVRVTAAMDQVSRLPLYPVITRQPSAIIEAVAAVNMTNDFAAPLVVIDGYEEFVLSATDGPPTVDHVVAIRAAAQEMGFALVIAGRLRGEPTDWEPAIDEVPEDLAHYSDVVLALAKSDASSTDWNVTSLKLTVVKHRTASPKATQTLRLERRGRYGWNVDQTADVSFGRSLRPIWPNE